MAHSSWLIAMNYELRTMNYIMLMAVDVGNTTISIGIFETDRLIYHSRIRVAEQKTLFNTLSNGINPDILNQIKIIAVASVNPDAEKTFCAWAKKACNTTPLKVGTDIPIKIPILVENPEKVGVDRLLNAIAAFQRMRIGAIVVDFGTAITFDVVSDKGEYLGGAIAPGIEISAYALNVRTAFLPRVAINKPSYALGKNTEEAIRSGVYWGTVGMVERILKELFHELTPRRVSEPTSQESASYSETPNSTFEAGQPKVIATGGDAELIRADIPLISDIIPHLTLEGIRLAYTQSLAIPHQTKR